MVVGELLKSLTGWPTPLEPRFQFDVLRGPALGQLLPQARRQDCICTTRAKNIEKVRESRRSPALSSQEPAESCSGSQLHVIVLVLSVAPRVSW
jgi:hypothetical protein